MKKDPARAVQAPERMDAVMRYHQQTKHHFFRYTHGPDSLDCASQLPGVLTVDLGLEAGGRRALGAADQPVER
jgi:hypothetical protein